ncbi:MAG: PGPGW domain-containing protein [Candidatus Eisenbacteria bacterium]
MFAWIQVHGAASWWMAGASVVTFVAALAIAPWVVVRIPADYFAGRRRPETYRARQRPVVWAVVLLVKNAIGAVFVLAGMVMLVLPGQGVLTIMLGLALMNFPGKFRLERWIVSRGPTLRLINRLRSSRGRPDLVLEDGV